MAEKSLKYFDVLTAKKAYAEGKNVTELLRIQRGIQKNTPEIIETAYDLQAGTYIEHVERNPEQPAAYATELATILDKHVKADDKLLDIGTGELTTLSLLTQKLITKPSRIFAFDISWSRIYKGLAYAQKHMARDYARLTPFAADIGQIPLLDKSINVTTSSHALEPNGGNLSALLNELFRVTIDKLVLFEPCYEINSPEGKQRMDKLGYIKNMEEVVREAGGSLIARIVIKNIANPLNPTACYVICPPPMEASPVRACEAEVFSVPGTNFSLEKLENFYFSKETGLCFPVLKSIPILRSNSSVLASALSDTEPTRPA